MARDKNRLGKVDSVVSLVQWAWDRSAALLVGSAAGGGVTWLASATEWMNSTGPLSWGVAGLAAALTVYWTMIGGRALAARARLARAMADAAESVAGGSAINPLKGDFVRERIRLSDLISPAGSPLRSYTFKNCELIGPAVLFLDPDVVFRANHVEFVEFIKINPYAGQLWPNKIVMHGGLIEGCVLVNVILLVSYDLAAGVERSFGQAIQWMNDMTPEQREEIARLDAKGAEQ